MRKKVQKLAAGAVLHRQPRTELFHQSHWVKCCGRVAVETVLWSVCECFRLLRDLGGWANEKLCVSVCVCV